MLLITTVCPPVPIPTEATPAPSDSSSNVSAERGGLEPPATPAVTPPTVPRITSATTGSFAIDTATPPKLSLEPINATPTAHATGVPTVDETTGLAEQVSAPVTTDETRSATTASQIDTDPCPLPLPQHADHSATDKHRSLGEQPSPKSSHEQDAVTLDKEATLTQRLVEDAAQQQTQHPTDMTLDEITTVSVPETLSLTVATQAQIEEEAAATGAATTESRHGRSNNSLERPDVEAALPALAPVELKPSAIKDFFRQFRRDESLNLRHSQPELKEPSRPNGTTVAAHSALTPLSSLGRSEEQHASRNIDSDSPGHAHDLESASRVTLALNSTPAATHSKSISAVTGTVAEQLASAVLSQLEAEPLATSRTFRLRLDPRELGPVEVQLTVVNDVVSIHFVAHDESARHAISRQLDELRQSLTDSGISFGQFDVSSQTGSDHGSQSSGEDHAPRRPLAPTPFTWSRYQTLELRDERHSGRLNFVA